MPGWGVFGLAYGEGREKSMRRTILAALALLLFAAFPLAAHADPRPKNKLYFTAGGAFVFGNGAAGKNSAVFVTGAPGGSNFDDIFGKGFSFNGYLGGPLTDNFSAQIGYTGDFYPSGTFADLEAHWGMVELKFNSRLGSFDPYVLGGIGMVIGNIKLPGVAANTNTGVEFAMTAAGGAEIYLGDAFALQPEVRVRIVKDAGIWIYPVSLGVNLFFLIE